MDNSRVSFSLGADEDDLESLVSMPDDLDIQFIDDEEEKSAFFPINHFNHLHKTSTMPNLHLVSCT